MRAGRVIMMVAAVGLAASSQLEWGEAEAAKATIAGKVTFYRGEVLRAKSEKGPWKKLKRNKKF